MRWWLGLESATAAVLYGATLTVGSVYFNGIWRWAERPLIAEVQQVLALMAEGRSNTAIAGALVVGDGAGISTSPTSSPNSRSPRPAGTGGRRAQCPRHRGRGGGAGAEKMSSRSNTKWVAQTSLLTAVLSVVLVAPAAAAGNAQLNKQIISNPISGFQQLSTQNLQSEVTYLDQLEKAGIGPHGEPQQLQ